MRRAQSHRAREEAPLRPGWLGNPPDRPEPSAAAGRTPAGALRAAGPRLPVPGERGGLRGCGSPGRPSPAALSRWSSGFPGSEAGHSAAIAAGAPWSQEKDDPRPAGPRPPRDSGSRMNLGGDHAARTKARDVFRKSFDFRWPLSTQADSRSATFPG